MIYNHAVHSYDYACLTGFDIGNTPTEMRGMFDQLTNDTHCNLNYTPIESWLVATQRLLSLTTVNCTPFKQFKRLLLQITAANWIISFSTNSKHSRLNDDVCESLKVMLSNPDTWHQRSGVYAITNNALNKFYIGESKQLGERFRQHLVLLQLHKSQATTKTDLHAQHSLYNYFKGVDTMSCNFLPILFCPKSLAKQAERKLIYQHQSLLNKEWTRKENNLTSSVPKLTHKSRRARARHRGKQAPCSRPKEKGFTTFECNGHTVLSLLQILRLTRTQSPTTILVTPRARHASNYKNVNKMFALSTTCQGPMKLLTKAIKNVTEPTKFTIYSIKENKNTQTIFDNLHNLATKPSAWKVWRRPESLNDSELFKLMAFIVTQVQG